jgi:hypothetical protein
MAVNYHDTEILCSPLTNSIYSIVQRGRNVLGMITKVEILCFSVFLRGVGPFSGSHLPIPKTFLNNLLTPRHHTSLPAKEVDHAHASCQPLCLESARTFGYRRG